MRKIIVCLAFLALIGCAQAVETVERAEMHARGMRPRRGRGGQLGRLAHKLRDGDLDKVVKDGADPRELRHTLLERAYRLHHHHEHKENVMAMRAVRAANIGAGKPAMPVMDLYDVESTKDFVDFLKGFAYGMDTVLGDPEKCISEAKTVMQDMTAAYSDLKNGFKHLKISQIAKGITELGNALENVAAGLKDCGLIALAEDIIKIVVEIRSGMIKQFIKDEIIHIISHQRELYHLFKGIVENWQHGDFYGVGDDVGQIVAILLEGVKEDSPVTIRPADVFAFAKGIAEGLGSSMGDPEACTQDIDFIIADFEAAWKDIQLGVKRISVKIIKRALEEFADGLKLIGDAMEKCGLQELERAIREVVELVREGKAIQVIAREIVHIFVHGKEFIGYFKNASSSWKDGRYEDSGKEVGKIVGFLVEIPPAVTSA